MWDRPTRASDAGHPNSWAGRPSQELGRLSAAEGKTDRRTHLLVTVANAPDRVKKNPKRRARRGIVSLRFPCRLAVIARVLGTGEEDPSTCFSGRRQRRRAFAAVDAAQARLPKSPMRAGSPTVACPQFCRRYQ